MTKRSSRAGERALAVLVVNAGSSSLKYQLFAYPGGPVNRPTVVTSGIVEGIGESQRAQWRYEFGTERANKPVDASNHGEALTLVREQLNAKNLHIDCCGHRVVHGGSDFSAPAVVDAAALERISELRTLAPLHNPHNALGIRVAREAFPDATQVAVFDTAFHATMPERAWRYPIERSLADSLGVRRYGFHGTSHGYVHRRAAGFLGREGGLTCITMHLGNGCSLAAIQAGEVVDTSMGMTPLAGVCMGTRSGDIDPSICAHLAAQRGMSAAEVDTLLNKRSGLLGICGHNDMRTIERMAAGDGAGKGVRDAERASAQLAIDIYVHRVRHYLGAYWLQLGKLDAVIFTAGVGENSALIRGLVMADLGHMGAQIDEGKNAACSKGAPGHDGDVADISAPGSRVPILVVNTNEELEIAEQARMLVDSSSAVSADDAP